MFSTLMWRVQTFLGGGNQPPRPPGLRRVPPLVSPGRETLRAPAARRPAKLAVARRGATVVVAFSHRGYLVTAKLALLAARGPLWVAGPCSLAAGPERPPRQPTVAAASVSELRRSPGREGPKGLPAGRYYGGKRRKLGGLGGWCIPPRKMQMARPLAGAGPSGLTRWSVAPSLGRAAGAYSGPKRPRSPCRPAPRGHFA